MKVNYFNITSFFKSIIKKKHQIYIRNNTKYIYIEKNGQKQCKTIQMEYKRQINIYKYMTNKYLCFLVKGENTN